MRSLFDWYRGYTCDDCAMHDRGHPARVPGGGSTAPRRCWRRDRSLPWLKRSRRKRPIRMVAVRPDGGSHSCESLHAARSLRRVSIATPCFYASAHQIRSWVVAWRKRWERGSSTHVTGQGNLCYIHMHPGTAKCILSRGVIPRAKDGGSHAHVCGPGGDGLLEIGRHAHGQLQAALLHAQRLCHRLATRHQARKVLGARRIVCVDWKAGVSLFSTVWVLMSSRAGPHTCGPSL